MGVSETTIRRARRASVYIERRNVYSKGLSDGSDPIHSLRGRSDPLFFVTDAGIRNSLLLELEQNDFRSRGK